MGAGCFLNFDLGAVAAGDGVMEGCWCCLDFEERGRRTERERKRLNPVRFTGGSSDGMGGMGMCA